MRRATAACTAASVAVTANVTGLTLSLRMDAKTNRWLTANLLQQLKTLRGRNEELKAQHEALSLDRSGDVQEGWKVLQTGTELYKGIPEERLSPYMLPNHSYDIEAYVRQDIIAKGQPFWAMHDVLGPKRHAAISSLFSYSSAGRFAEDGTCGPIATFKTPSELKLRNFGSQGTMEALLAGAHEEDRPIWIKKFIQAAFGIGVKNATEHAKVVVEVAQLLVAWILRNPDGSRSPLFEQLILKKLKTDCSHADFALLEKLVKGENMTEVHQHMLASASQDDFGHRDLESDLSTSLDMMRTAQKLSEAGKKCESYDMLSGRRVSFKKVDHVILRDLCRERDTESPLYLADGYYLPHDVMPSTFSHSGDGSGFFHGELAICPETMKKIINDDGVSFKEGSRVLLEQFTGK